MSLNLGGSITTNRVHSANVRIPMVKSIDEDATITTKNSAEPEASSYISSNIVLTGHIAGMNLVEEGQSVHSARSGSTASDDDNGAPMGELQKDSEAVWQTISSCEVEPFALSNFNFTIPYMDIYDEKLSGSKVLRRPPKNSLWAQTGEDDMMYIEESTKEQNARKEKAELFKYNSFLEDRRKSMIVPPRQNSAIADGITVSRPSSAAFRPEGRESCESEGLFEDDEFQPMQEALPEIVETAEERAFRESVNKMGKTKKKLGKLVDYVQGHANRKIIGEWDLVKTAFRKSPSFEVRMAAGSNKPIQIKTMGVAALVSLLAASSIQFKRKEISGLCDTLNIPAADQARVRRMAALKITIEATTDENVKMRCNAKLKELDAIKKEQYISLSQLQGHVFPDTKEALEFELRMIEKEKLAKRMIEDEENKKKLAYADIVEQRRLKSIEDFHKALHTLQYARGPLNPQREYVLREVIDYAMHVLSVQEASRLTVIDPAVISNLGDDAFCLDDDIESTANDTKNEIYIDPGSKSYDAGDDSPFTPNQRRPISGSRFRTNLRGVTPEQIAEMKTKASLKLHGEETMLALLTAAVSLGKGLNGVSFKDVIELVQAFAVTRIQAFFRCHTKRWRFEKARKCWKKAFSATKGRVFQAWAQEAYKMGQLKLHCMRKVVVWKFYAKRLKERRVYFKQCFWPFYVWRRSVMATTTTKQKTKFLCGRVVPTLISMRVFRAWAQYAIAEAHYNRKSDKFNIDRIQKGMRNSYFWLKYWVRRRRAIRHSWLTEGLTMKRKFDDRCVKRPFQVWYSYIQLKRRLNSSIRANCSLFRSFIFPNRDFTSDRDISHVNPESSLISDTSSASKRSKKSKNSTATSTKSKPKKRRKSVTDQQGQFNVALVKVYGKRKTLKINGESDFKWHMKQIRYDIEEDDGDEVELFPTNPYIQEAFSRPGSRTNARRPSSVGAVIRAPGSPEQNILDDISIASYDNQQRHHSRRGSGPRAILLSDVKAFAEDDRSDFHTNRSVHVDEEEAPPPEPTYNTVSDMLKNVFDTKKIKMAEYNPVALFHHIRPGTVESIQYIQDLMDDSEIGALIETAFRYHHWAMRAFKNLERHAKLRHNLKIGLKKKRHARLRMIFKVLSDNLNRSLCADITTSVTEQLINEARIMKIDKFSRRRELTDAIKAYQDQQVNLERKRIQAFKASLRNSSTNATAGTVSSAINSRGQTPGSGLNNQQGIDEQGSLFAEGSIATVKEACISSRGIRTPSSSKGRRGSKSGRSAALIVNNKPQSREANRSAVEIDSTSIGGMDDSCSVGTAATAVSAFDSTLANAGGSIATVLSEPPKVDYLFWDREDRELQFNNVQRLVAHGRRMLSMTQYCTDILSRGEDHVLKLQAKKFLALSEVEAIQDFHTKESIEREEAFVKGFRVYAANILLNCVYKVQQEFKIAMVKSCLREYFRALRLSMLLKRSKHMCNRKKMVNWIRLCRRLKNIDKLSPKYWRNRQMWGVFNRWLKYFERSHMDATASVITRARRGWELRKGFADHLYKKRIVLTYYHPTNKKIRHACTERSSIFQRWKQFTQDEVMYRLLEQFVEHRYKLILLRKVIFGWRYNTCTHAEQRVKINGNPDCYAIAHITEDIDQIMKRYMSRVRLSLHRKLKRINMRFTFCVRRDARKVLSFKAFIKQFHREVDERIEQENAMLLAAFETRGTLQYRQTRLLPKMATLNDGDRFSDPAYNHYSRPFHGLQIPGGYLISRIRIALKGTAGLVGWQLYWDADKGLPIVGPERGVMSGIGVVTHDIILSPLDFLVEIEYIYEGNEMAAIKFKTFKTGWTKWYGSKPSLTATTASLKAAQTTEELAGLTHELEYHSTGADEVRDPVLPVSYIIGFIGMDNSERATCLGLILRHTITQNVFSYYWVNEGSDKQLFQQEPAIEVQERMEENIWDEDEMFAEAEEAKVVVAAAKVSRTPIQSRPGSGNSEVGNRPGTGNQSHTLPPISSASKKTSTPTVKPPSSDRRASSAFGAMGGPPPELLQNGPPPGQKKGATGQMDDENETTESEDTFFDICRMRSVELKQLEQRTDTFIRKIWTSPKLRYSSRQESKLVGMTVLKGIATWFFEGLCKKLVPLAKHAIECRRLMKAIRMLNLKKNQGDARLDSLRSGLLHMKSVEKQQPWYGKSFLGPLDRVQRKSYFDNIADYEQSIEKLELDAKESAVDILSMTKQIRILTPQLQLSKWVLNNFTLKLMAGRQKYTLLERMTLEQMKSQLMGNDAKRAAAESSAGVGGGPQDPNLVSMSLEQVCAVLESKRLDEEHKYEQGSIASSSIRSNIRKTLTDEANSITGHSLDAEVGKMIQSYPEGTFGHKMAEGRSVWENKRHIADVLNRNRSLNQLASPKRIHLPKEIRKGVSTNASPSLRQSASFVKGTDSSPVSYDAMLAVSSSTSDLRKIPTIEAPLVVPGRRGSNATVQLSKSMDIVARRGQALLQEKSRFLKSLHPIETTVPQYVANLTEEDIANQKDFELNIHTFLAEQAILEKQRADAVKRKEEFLQRKAEMKKLTAPPVTLK